MRIFGILGKKSEVLNPENVETHAKHGSKCILGKKDRRNITWIFGNGCKKKGFEKMKYVMQGLKTTCPQYLAYFVIDVIMIILLLLLFWAIRNLRYYYYFIIIIIGYFVIFVFSETFSAKIRAKISNVNQNKKAKFVVRN